MLKVITSDLDDYLRDESKLAGGYASEAAFPASISEVAEYLRSCWEKRTRITVSGARTGIVGGAVPMGGAVLSTERMQVIKEFHYEPGSDEWVVKVEPGVSLTNLQKCIQEKAALDSGFIEGITGFRKDPRRFFFPVDATESSASIGGMTATNASGARSLGYGPMRTYIKGLRVVLADGEILDIKRNQYSVNSSGNINLTTASGKNISIPAPDYHIPQVKHTAGFYSSPALDPIDLFIGSEGLLGVIVEIELALAVEPELWFGGLAFFASEVEAVRFVRLVRDEPAESRSLYRPAALEFFDFAALQLFNGTKARKELLLPEIPSYARAAVFFEQGCSEPEFEPVYSFWEKALPDCGSSIDEVWSGIDPQANQKLKSMRHQVPEEVNRIVSENRKQCPEISKIGTDLAVPNQYLEDLFDLYRGCLVQEQIPAVIFGHIGNNNLHVNMLPTDPTSLQKARSLHLKWAGWAIEHGGTVVAEHGIGKLKGELLRLLYPENILAQMRAVKQALDPLDILAPGNAISGFGKQESLR
jgi:D-lactate dehydrogenase (cytochrome)